MSEWTTVTFYISGHGFGHASRQIEVINALTRLRPDCRVLVRTSAPRWLFDTSLTGTVDIQPVTPDTGVVQIDSLHVDVDATVARARDFYRTFDARIVSESRRLARERTVLVIGDIPPLAFAAAAAAGVPGIAVGNFTWDWIYAHYRTLMHTTPDLLPRMRDAYAAAHLALRLPMSGGFETFGTVVDVPLIARHARRAPAETRAILGLPATRPLMLVSFGKYGLGAIEWTRVRALRELGVVLTHDPIDSGSVADAVDAANLYRIDLPAAAAQGVRYEDLVAAVDIVLTKPGYGIIAECAANDTALVYTSRGEFAEYRVLVEAMPRLLRCAFIDHADLFAGQWQRAVDAVLSRPPVTRPRTDGAQVIARYLSSHLCTTGA